MSDLSRRALIAAGGGGVAALAGCSVRIGADETIDDERLRGLASTRPLTTPHRFPFRVTDEMFTRHRTRARELVESVPASPDVPNQLVRDAIESRREQLSRRLPARGESTPTGSGERGSDGEDEPADWRLSELRERRAKAGDLQGTYRAATGAVAASDVRRRRDRLRDRLAEFRTAWTYRGTGPLAAVHRNHELETLVSGVEHELEPWPPFPSSPAADVDEVGHLVRKLEAAAAALDDVEAFRRQQPADGQSYRPAMFATATWLRRRARREAESVEQYRDAGRSAFDRDLGDSVARHLFDASADVIRRYTNGELLESIDREQYAGAVLFAGTRRAAVTTFARIVADIEGGWEEDVSVTAIDNRRTRAREAVEAARDGTPDALVEVHAPAYGALRDGVEALERGNGQAALARFEYARRCATVAADATGEVAFLLRSAAEH